MPYQSFACLIKFPQTEAYYTAVCVVLVRHLAKVLDFISYKSEQDTTDTEDIWNAELTAIEFTLLDTGWVVQTSFKAGVLYGSVWRQNNRIHCSALYTTHTTWCIFSDNRGSFLGLDLSELPFEVSGCEHIHGEAGHLDQDDAVLALGIHGVCVAWRRILFRHIRYQGDREQPGSLTQQHGYSNLPPLSVFQSSFTSSPFLILSSVVPHASDLLLSSLYCGNSISSSMSVRWRLCRVKVWSLNVYQTSMCGGACAVAGRGCLACYSNTAEWGRCWVTQSRPASFHRHRKREGWV